MGSTAGSTDAPLHALSNAVAANNGVYVYGGGGVFPAQTYQATNYWVDVVYVLTVGPDTTPPTVTKVTPAANMTGVMPSATVTAAFSEAMAAATITTSTFTLRNTATSAAVAATVSYGNGIATLTPSTPLSNATNYTATVRGGAGGVKDVAGNPLASDFVLGLHHHGPEIVHAASGRRRQPRDRLRMTATRSSSE